MDIWYLCDLVLCNFDCAYCASGNPDRGGGRSRTKMWAEERSADRFRRIVGWIEELPIQDVGLRLQTIGEPFVSDEFLAAAARLTTRRHLKFVELVTNGSLLKKRLRSMIDDHRADVGRLSLWVTFHHTEIGVDAFIENVRHAHELGAHVVANTLLFPDNREAVADMLSRCEDLGIRTSLDLGLNFGNAYDGAPFVPAMELEGSREKLLVTNKKMTAVSLVAIAAPLGLRCSAGHDYIYVASDGTVYPCRGYHAWLGGEAVLGSALDPGFVPRLTAELSPCKLAAGCTCKEDYLHLDIAKPGPRRERSIGYWPHAEGGDDVPEEIKARLRTALRAPLLRVID